MNKYLFPSISIEKMAAYLDNNLPEAEMREIDSIINDVEYVPLFEELTNIGDDVLTNPITTGNSELEELDTLSIPDIHGYDLDPMASFVDDFFIHDAPEDTTMNSGNDSDIEQNPGDGF